MLFKVKDRSGNNIFVSAEEYEFLVKNAQTIPSKDECEKCALYKIKNEMGYCTHPNLGDQNSIIRIERWKMNNFCPEKMLKLSDSLK